MNRKTKTSVQNNQKKFKKKSILIHFDYEKSAIIDADISEHIIKTCLQQLNNQKQK